jgi:hypothetical protein
MILCKREGKKQLDVVIVIEMMVLVVVVKNHMIV